MGEGFGRTRPAAQTAAQHCARPSSDPPAPALHCARPNHRSAAQRSLSPAASKRTWPSTTLRAAAGRAARQRPGSHPTRLTGGPRLSSPTSPLSFVFLPQHPCRDDTTGSPFDRTEIGRESTRASPTTPAPEALASRTPTPYTCLDAIPRRLPQPWPGMAIKANSRSPSTPIHSATTPRLSSHAPNAASKREKQGGAGATTLPGPPRTPEQGDHAAVFFPYLATSSTALRTRLGTTPTHRCSAIRQASPPPVSL